MKKIMCILLLLITAVFVFATERTDAGTFFIAIDKSLSMDESGAFKEVQSWLTSDFIPKTLTSGDRIILFVFYGQTEKVIDMTLNSTADFASLTKQISGLNADGRFTDIGGAIDLVRNAINSSGSKGLTSMMFITDAKQEADWPSAYAGCFNFKNRYMQQDRVISHGNKWYEIQVRINSNPTSFAKQLYSIIQNAPQERAY